MYATDWRTADPGSVKPGLGIGMYPSGHTALQTLVRPFNCHPLPSHYHQGSAWLEWKLSGLHLGATMVNQQQNETYSSIASSKTQYLPEDQAPSRTKTSVSVAKQVS